MGYNNFTDRKQGGEMIEKDEKWKWIDGYEGSYMISDMGRVMSFRKRTGRNGTGDSHRPDGRILKPQSTPQGYLIIRLYDLDKNYKQQSIHSLVAQAFLGDRPTQEDGAPYDIDHINGKRDDNRLSNIRYITHNDNVLRSDLAMAKRKPIIQWDMDGNFIREYDGAIDAVKLGFDKGSIGKVARGVKKSYKGYVWTFKNDDDFTGGE